MNPSIVPGIPNCIPGSDGGGPDLAVLEPSQEIAERASC